MCLCNLTVHLFYFLTSSYCVPYSSSGISPTRNQITPTKEDDQKVRIIKKINGPFDSRIRRGGERR